MRAGRENRRADDVGCRAARRHLSPEEVRALRQRKVAEKRAEGKSHRTIGEELGIDTKQVQRDLESIGDTVPNEPERITTSAGRTYPARRESPEPAASEKYAMFVAKKERIGNRSGERTDKQPVLCGAQVEPGQKTAEVAAQYAGNAYPDFDAFCRDRQPWGLGTDPAKFRAHLAAELGERAADLATVSPGTDKGGRPRKETSASDAEVSEGQSKRKEGQLRAILRAPEVIQHLYRDGKINQADAAKLGPRSPTPEKAARVAEARQEIERLESGYYLIPW